VNTIENDCGCRLVSGGRHKRSRAGGDSNHRWRQATV